MENKFFLFIIDVLARMLGMTSEEVVTWMVSMIKSMIHWEDHIPQMLKAWGIELYNYIDRARKEVYIGDAPSLEDTNTYKVIWHPGITAIHSRTLYGLPPIEELIIPETVTRIDNNALESLDVLRISFPCKLKSIPLFACSCCWELKQVEIPDSVERIEYGAFLYCKNLCEIRIPESVVAIEESAFKGCDSLPESVKEHIRMIGGPQALGEPSKNEVDTVETLKKQTIENKDDSNE